MSFWSKVHRAFLINSNLHTFLISLAISTIFILAICICRLIFIPAASRQYMPSEHDHVEDIELYTIGGLHPVHLGDIYDNRYKILHKLGSGGFSTVWLVRDTVLSSYVALKIILAEESQDSSELEVLNLLGTRTDEKSSGKEGRKYMGTLLDYCTIYGPNGHHLCLVSDLMGPSISALSDSPGKIGDGRRLQAGFTQRIARQVVQALRFMHLRNLCHGDLTSSNILYRTASIDHLSEEELYLHLGKPKTDPVVTLPRPWWAFLFRSHEPRYLVEGLIVDDPQFLVDEIQLVDFGLSFHGPLKNEINIGIPYSYRAPETIIENEMDELSEVWSLGCVLYELRNGQRLFESRSEGKDEIVAKMVNILGQAPEKWILWLKLWDERRAQDIEDEDSNAGLSGKSMADDGVKEGQRKSEVFFGRCDVGLPLEESVQFGDLLNGIFKWIPEERLSLDEILGHPW